VTHERTVLEWIYDPADLFEAPYQHTGVDFDLLVDAGRAVVTLRVPQDPVSPDVEARVSAAIERVFLVRQLQMRRKYSLDGPMIYQHVENRMSTAFRVRSTAIVFTAGHADFITTDAAENIVRDTRAERIAAHHSDLDSLVPKLGRSITLRSMCESYARSITDPNNALVHLNTRFVMHFPDTMAASSLHEMLW
jgi:hypothetical protein